MNKDSSIGSAAAAVVKKEACWTARSIKPGGQADFSRDLPGLSNFKLKLAAQMKSKMSVCMILLYIRILLAMDSVSQQANASSILLMLVSAHISELKLELHFDSKLNSMLLAVI